MKSPRKHSGELRTKNDDLVTSCIVGVFALLLSMTLTKLWSGAEMGFARNYREMSGAPFVNQSPFPHRLLLPLVAWCLGFRGENSYLYFCLALPAIFLSLVSLWVRRITDSLTLAVVLPLCFASTSLVQYHLAVPGLPDLACYSFVLASLLWPVFSPLFTLAGLLSHEFYLGFLPILFLLAWAKVPVGKEGMWCRWKGHLCAVLTYVLARYALLPQPFFSLHYYRDEMFLVLERLNGVMLTASFAAFEGCLVLPFMMLGSRSIGWSEKLKCIAPLVISIVLITVWTCPLDVDG